MVSRDAALLARTAEGDAQAFQQLVDRHSSAVLNVIYRIVLSRADAEDLCQEVFVRLWKQAPSWQDEAKLSTWLYRVASNLAINHSQRVQQRFVVDGELAEQLADASTPLNDEPGDLPALAAALSALPEEQRAAIAFRYYREMPVRDIADVLGNSPKAVESLLGRARKRLRQLLGENND